MTETWKPVVGYEGLYEVSDHGRVRSLDRVVPRSNGSTYAVQGRAMSSRTDRDGYQLVNLRLDKTQRTYKVHRLVLEAFRGPCPLNYQACHYDDDPANNRLDNLRWGTTSENRLDAVRNGGHNNASKTHCPQGHEYTEENTYSPPSRPGGRYCRTCHRERQTRRDQRRAA